MVAPVNERLQDAATSHAVDLTHYSNGVVRRMIALLNSVDASLFSAITDALERLSPESFTVERLDQLLASVRALNAQAYDAIEQDMKPELRKLAEYESGYQYKLFRVTFPPQIIAQVNIATVGVEQVYAAALARPFQGVLLREALSEVSAQRAKLIRDQIRIGYVSQEPIAQIVQRLRGTRAKGYADGLLEAPRHHVESIVRTAVSHTAGVVRQGFFDANIDLIKALRWVATLDSRTSEICRVRDGLDYTPDTHKPIGHKVPWLGGPGAAHWNCRSCSSPITKRWAELGSAVDIGEFSPATRASMDGQVPSDTTYGAWLAKQSAARQDQVLGPTRGKLLRQGGLTVDKFSNDKGRWLSLDELRAQDDAAFNRAGL